ncbi:MAG: hypothetical protein ACI9S8_003023 [Chlamydiales bacterium]|jgi:hypothetical protein
MIVFNYSDSHKVNVSTSNFFYFCNYICYYHECKDLETIKAPSKRIPTTNSSKDKEAKL